MALRRSTEGRRVSHHEEHQAARRVVGWMFPVINELLTLEVLAVRTHSETLTWEQIGHEVGGMSKQLAHYRFTGWRRQTTDLSFFRGCMFSGMHARNAAADLMDAIAKRVGVNPVGAELSGSNTEWKRRRQLWVQAEPTTDDATTWIDDAVDRSRQQKS